MPSPAFWYSPPERPALLARLLAPLGRWQAGGAMRRLSRATPVRAGAPVIRIASPDGDSADEATAAIALVQHLQARGAEPAVLSPSMGEATARPIAVDPGRDDPVALGDDALLMAAFAPVWVAGDPAACLPLIPFSSSRVFVLTGDLRQAAIAPDVTILAVDASRGFGNGLCRPAGPMHLPVATALARANLLLSVGPPEVQRRFATQWHHLIQTPHLRGALAPLQTGMDWRDTPVLAFAGIRHPERFFAALRTLGATLARAEALDDRQPLTPALMTRLEGEARLLGAQLVTTEKDAVRLPDAFRSKVLTLPMRLALEETATLDEVLDRALSASL